MLDQNRYFDIILGVGSLRVLFSYEFSSNFHNSNFHDLCERLKSSSKLYLKFQYIFYGIKANLFCSKFRFSSFHVLEVLNCYEFYIAYNELFYELI